MQLFQKLADCTLTNPGGNYTGNSYPSRSPFAGVSVVANAVSGSGLAANGDGVIDLSGGTFGPIKLRFLPFGNGTSGQSFLMTLLGWERTSGNFPSSIGGQQADNTANLWIPLTLASYTITLGTMSGVANANLNASQLFATTIVQTYGPVYGTGPAQFGENSYAGGAAIFSPGLNAGGGFDFMVRGFKFVEAIYNCNSSATGANSLVRQCA